MVFAIKGVVLPLTVAAGIFPSVTSPPLGDSDIMTEGTSVSAFSSYMQLITVLDCKSIRSSQLEAPLFLLAGPWLMGESRLEKVGTGPQSCLMARRPLCS